MDSDDYSKPTRIEEQFKQFEETKGLDIVGTNVEEFSGNIHNIVSHVVLPENNEDIIKFSKKRCPFRHPTLLIKKDIIIKAGNYREYYLCEDYDIYTRMISAGANSKNIQKPLMYMRVSEDFYKRRGGVKYARSIFKFKKEQLKRGYYTKIDFLVSTVPHMIICLSPATFRRWVYKNLLRKKAD